MTDNENRRPPGRRAANREMRRQLDGARQAGIARRHQNKLAHLRNTERPPARTSPDAPHAGTPDALERESLRSGFGAELRRARHSAGLTQTELGRKACLSRESVSRLERGAQRPEAGSLRRLVWAVAPDRASRSVLHRRLWRLAGPSVREWRRRGGVARLRPPEDYVDRAERQLGRATELTELSGHRITDATPDEQEKR